MSARGRKFGWERGLDRLSCKSALGQRTTASLALKRATATGPLG